MTSPIYLFSDSQLLFWKEGERYFSERFLPKDKLPAEVRAAYIGASNRDNPDYFELFRQAMLQIGVRSCSLIPSEPTSQDLDFLEVAEIILLAGGDVKLGWEVMLQNGMAKIIQERYRRGVTLIGISAGAIQFSLKGFDSNGLFDAFQMVPFLIDVHDEANGWKRLIQFAAHDPNTKAYGIPFGAGLIYHPEGHMEMVRRKSIVI